MSEKRIIELDKEDIDWLKLNNSSIERNIDLDKTSYIRLRISGELVIKEK